MIDIVIIFMIGFIGYIILSQAEKFHKKQKKRDEKNIKYLKEMCLQLQSPDIKIIKPHSKKVEGFLKIKPHKQRGA